jgi:zinc protease
VGDFDPGQAVALAERYLGRIPANPKGVPEVITLEPPQPAEQRMVADVETTPSIQIDFKAVPAVHRDAPALQALGGILGGAQLFGGRPGAGGGRPPTGRLNKSLVLEKKVATQTSASFRGMKYGGLFALRATPVQGKRPEELEPLLYAEIERIAQEGVTEDELQRFKNATQVGLYTRLESNTGIRETLAQALAVGTVQDFRDTPKRIQAVTREDVQRVARQYFARDSRNVLITHRKGGQASIRTSQERMQKLEGK